MVEESSPQYSEQQVQIEPSRLQGTISIPPSKSQTMRALLFAALARGCSSIESVLSSPDTDAMIRSLRQLGAKISRQETSLNIEGFCGRPQPADDVIQCGNSGIVLRFLSALAGLIPHYTIVTGDASIRGNRPMAPLLSALNQLGVFAVSSRGSGFAPIILRGCFSGGRAVLDGRDSQPVSALLIAAAFADRPIQLCVENPGEKPWIDLTLHWLHRLGISCEMQNYRNYQLIGASRIEGFSYRVPGDFSTAAFPLAAALLTHSDLILSNLDFSDLQGDRAMIPLLQEMGASISVEKDRCVVKGGDRLKGARIDVNGLIDALPILAVIGCFAEGKTELVNGAVARTKESDRIGAIVCELRKMGANIEEKEDGLVVFPSRLRGADLNSHGDHRIALSLIVASLAAEGKSRIFGTACIEKTCPRWREQFNSLGAKIDGF